MPNLFEIGIEGSELELLMVESAGEMTPELEHRWDEFLQGGKDKINAACHVRKRLEYEARVCREEAERLWARAKATEAERARLSERILFAVDRGFQGKVKTALFTVYGQNAAPSYEFRMAADADIAVFGDQNPDLVRVERSLNKVALKDLHKADLLPAEIVVDEIEGKRFLMVK